MHIFIFHSRKEQEIRDKQAEIARLREEEVLRKQQENDKLWRKDEEKRGGGRFDRDKRDEDSSSSWRKEVKPSEQAWKPSK